MAQHASFFYALLNREYFESLDRYEPSTQYIEIAQRHVGFSWEMKRGGYWTRFQPKDTQRRKQGWKIHLSASEHTAEQVLECALPVLVASQVAFKFCSDPYILRMSLNKNAPRTGAGKFVTVYPRSDEDFRMQCAQLHEALGDLWGPYLLTDRPYKDSKVIYYRYGGHLPMEQTDGEGIRRPMIEAPDGSWVEDPRVPVFRVPPWVKSPFPSSKPAATEPPAAPRAPAPKSGGKLLKDRYRIGEALKFNAPGGIYEAMDVQTGQPVIIREARHIRHPDPAQDYDIQLLEKEARILKRLEHTGYTPRFIDFFQQWEHRFLVQEKLDADSLWGHAMGYGVAAADQSVSLFFTHLRETVLKITHGLKALHANNVVVRDLTRKNIMVTRDDQVKFIDLEFAFELDREEPHTLSWTDGHSSPQQRRGDRPTPADDFYSLGAIILDQITFTAPGLDLNREGILRSFRQRFDDYGLPMEVYDIVLGLLEVDPARRWDLDRVISAFNAIPVPQHEKLLDVWGEKITDLPPPPSALLGAIEQTLSGISRFILAKADPSRDDRLWPTQPEVFSRNPLNLDYGAAGTAYFLHRQNGGLPRETVDWLLKHLDGYDCPPGLMSGLSGVALVLHEIGEHQAARNAMETAARSPLNHQAHDLFWGDAGWGLANLHFWHRTGESQYLMRACEAGEYLLRTKKESDKGASWDYKGETRLGLGHGQSGVALFLTYLAMARPGEGFLETAIKALDFELSEAQSLFGKLLWYPRVGARAGEPKSPSMRHGTAGVGTALLRAYVATGEPRLRKLAEWCAATVGSRHTNKLWLSYGLSGFGEYQLDMYRLLGDRQYLNRAFYMAEAILPHRIDKEEGIAFAADELFRISCDLGAGSAGIGLFLHRLLRPEQPRFLMLDELLPGRGAATTA
ncbi:class III lanthionine synthetase LanKC [Corallococcus carmarthensis]|nr:class III lanthionine synthetase LanKC [Corallococcus carmarthensis]